MERPKSISKSKKSNLDGDLPDTGSIPSVLVLKGGRASQASKHRTATTTTTTTSTEIMSSSSSAKAPSSSQKSRGHGTQSTKASEGANARGRGRPRLQRAVSVDTTITTSSESASTTHTLPSASRRSSTRTTHVKPAYTHTRPYTAKRHARSASLPPTAKGKLTSSIHDPARIPETTSTARVMPMEAVVEMDVDEMDEAQSHPPTESTDLPGQSRRSSTRTAHLPKPTYTYKRPQAADGQRRVRSASLPPTAKPSTSISDLSTRVSPILETTSTAGDIGMEEVEEMNVDEVEVDEGVEKDEPRIPNGTRA
ncbi:hypothetical protein HK102_009778, partial [Quaeritorhiza haematococci]